MHSPLIVGIVAEFNPFHNGHKFIIDYARNQLKADFIVVALSGDYVQRGEPAIFDKYVRSKAALLAGADCVFALPVHISTASANYYATGSVSLLDKLGCDILLFGSECGSVDILKKSEYVNGKIDMPNDILGREYIKAISGLNLSITPLTIKRTGSDYSNSETIEDGKCSSSYIRAHFNDIFDKNNNFDISSVMPVEIYKEYCNYLTNNKAMDSDSMTDYLFYKLQENALGGYNSCFDVFDDLSEKIVKNLNSYKSFSSFIDLLKSKDIKRAHISRALIHICLGITKDSIDLIKSFDYVPYARLIAYNKSSNALSEISRRSRKTIISKLSDYVKDCDSNVLDILNTDIRASHLYSHLASKHSFTNELTRQIIINS